MANIKPLFQSASKQATQIFSSEAGKIKVDDIVAYGAWALLTAGFFFSAYVAPDSAVLDGQDEHIQQYEESLTNLQEQKSLLEQKRQAFEQSALSAGTTSNIEGNTSILRTQLNSLDQNHQNNILVFLTSISLETQVSELEIGKLFGEFERTVIDVEDFTYDGEEFGDIADAAHLQECQIRHRFTKNSAASSHRAITVSNCADHADYTEKFVKGMSPVFGYLSLFIGMALLATINTTASNPFRREKATKEQPNKSPTNKR